MPFDGRILNGIGVLGAVVETRSFARASKALGLTPSGVSRAIARLEERLGVRLLQRTARSVTLTDEGRRFYEAVRPHMQGIEDAAGEAAGSTALPKGMLRVAVDSLVARVAIGPRIGSFFPEAQREALFREAGSKLLTKRIGEAAEIAEAYCYLMENTFTTGQTLVVDGGGVLV